MILCLQLSLALLAEAGMAALVSSIEPTRADRDALIDFAHTSLPLSIKSHVLLATKKS